MLPGWPISGIRFGSESASRVPCGFLLLFSPFFSPSNYYTVSCIPIGISIISVWCLIALFKVRVTTTSCPAKHPGLSAYLIVLSVHTQSPSVLQALSKAEL